MPRKNIEMKRQSTPLWAGLLLCASMHIGMLHAGHLGHGGLVFVTFWIGSLLSGLLVWYSWPKENSFRSAALILLIACAIRIPYLIWFAESDDLYRYLWEGMIQHSGWSPYLLAPNSPTLVPLRDAYWLGINGKSIPAIYPPLAQAAFALLDRASHSILLFKSFFTLCDLTTIGLLLAWSHKRGYQLRHVLLFALSPISIVFTSGEGHLDAVMVCALCAALYFIDTKRFRRGFFLLGCSVMFKIIPIILFPFLLTKKNLRYAWTALVPAVSIFAYKGNFFHVLFHFAGQTAYNGSLVSLCSHWFGTANATLIAGSIFLCIAGREFFFGADQLRSAYNIVCAFLLCATVLHPWYLLIAVLFLPFFRSPVLLTFYGTVAFTFVVNDVNRHTGLWQMPRYVPLFEYLPVAMVALYSVFTNRKTERVHFPAPQTCAVIVPTFNESRSIRTCLENLQKQTRSPDTIIVTDGGSTDDTRKIVQEFPGVRWIESAPGRGVQIASAAHQVDSDVLLVCHADCIPDPTVIARLMAKLTDETSMAGGAFAIRYNATTPVTRILEYLNSLKVILLGISFGDQCQFFRKVVVSDGFPALKLMEDVELSFLIRSKGSFGLLANGPVVSFRRWQSQGVATNAVRVFTLLFGYIVMRRFGGITGNADNFYKRYYASF